MDGGGKGPPPLKRNACQGVQTGQLDNINRQYKKIVFSHTILKHTGKL